jgi:hypothetical protein
MSGLHFRHVDLKNFVLGYYSLVRRVLEIRFFEVGSY